MLMLNYIFVEVFVLQDLYAGFSWFLLGVVCKDRRTRRLGWRYVSVQQLLQLLWTHLPPDGIGPTNSMDCLSLHCVDTMMLKLTGLIHLWLGPPRVCGFELGRIKILLPFFSNSRLHGWIFQMYYRLVVVGESTKVTLLFVRAWYWMKGPGISWWLSRPRQGIILAKWLYFWKSSGMEMACKTPPSPFRGSSRWHLHFIFYKGPVFWMYVPFLIDATSMSMVCLYKVLRRSYILVTSWELKFSPGVHLIVKMKVSYQLQFRPSPHLRNQLLHPAPHRKLHAVLRILQRMQFLKNIHKQYMCFGPPTKGDGSRTSMQWFRQTPDHGGRQYTKPGLSYDLRHGTTGVSMILLKLITPRKMMWSSASSLRRLTWRSLHMWCLWLSYIGEISLFFERLRYLDSPPHTIFWISSDWFPGVVLNKNTVWLPSMGIRGPASSMRQSIMGTISASLLVFCHDKVLIDILQKPFNKMMELHRWQHIDSVGAARLLGDSSQAAALSPGPLPLPRTTSMSDWYWITMSILMWAATFGLLMRICPCEKRAPCRLICIRGRRTKRSCVRCHNPMRLKPIVFTALLLSQHVTTLEGLQLHQASQLRSSWDLSQLSISPELDPGPQPVLVAHPEVHWDSFARLPPPGNTTGCDIFLTDEGRRFLDFLCEFLESKLQSKQEVKVLLLDKALERKQILLADHLPSDRCTDVDGSGPPFLSVAEVSPVHFAQPEISAQPSIVHLPDQDPSQLHDGMCRFPFNSKDTEDLFVEWDVTPFPDLPPPSDLNTAVNYVLQLPFVHADDDVQLYIYTDGSFDKHTDIATWAFVVFAIEDQQVYVRDWYADFISIDPMDSSWLGVTQVGIRGAEATAIIYAILYAMQSHRAEVVHIFSDALSIVRSTTGHWILQPDDFIGVNLRAVFLAATILRKGLTTDLTHVKSHCGILGNEFADFLAVGIREQRIAPRPVPRAFEYWFQGIDPHIRHVWLVFDLLHRERATPTLNGDVLSWKPPLKTDGCDWLPCKPLHEKATAAKRCDLLIKCVQYNVCTLRKPGATAYMREQLAYYQVHIAAFQESRTPSSEIQDSNFIRLIAPATGGQGGCELWFATHIPLGTHGGERIFFSRSQLIVLHAEAEMLFVVMNRGPCAETTTLGGQNFDNYYKNFNYNVAPSYFWMPTHMLAPSIHGLETLWRMNLTSLGKNCLLFVVISRFAFPLHFHPYTMALQVHGKGQGIQTITRGLTISVQAGIQTWYGWILGWMLTLIPAIQRWITFLYMGGSHSNTALRSPHPRRQGLTENTLRLQLQKIGRLSFQIGLWFRGIHRRQSTPLSQNNIYIVSCRKFFHTSHNIEKILSSVSRHGRSMPNAIRWRRTSNDSADLLLEYNCDRHGVDSMVEGGRKRLSYLVFYVELVGTNISRCYPINYTDT